MENDYESSTCRACLTEASSFINLEWEHDSGFSFLEIFNLCTKDINATQDDELPQILCDACTINLSTAFKFLRLAKESDRILRERITVEENSENSQDKKSFKEEEKDFYEDNWISEDPLADAECKNDTDTDWAVANQSNGESIWEPEPELKLKSPQTKRIVRKSKKDIDCSPSNPMKCEVCPKAFKTEKSLRVHRQFAHKIISPQKKRIRKSKKDIDCSSSNPMKCEDCPKAFKQENSLRTHRQFAHNIIDPRKPHICNICGKKCSSPVSLKSHLYQHSGERPFGCELCDKSYLNIQDLRVHMFNIHPDGSREFVCKICKEKFPTHQKLRSHRISLHMAEKYLCSFCPRKFKKRSQHTSHERTHTGEKPFECQECDAKFGNMDGLNSHKQTHTGEKPFQCNVCGKRFAQSSSFHTHMSLHMDKTVECPDCDQKFSRPSFLIRHRRIHTGERPYACHLCPSTYLQKSHLSVHISRHFPKKQKCEVCGKQYRDQKSFKYHMFEHSGKPKPYQCDECGASFYLKYRYRLHLKIHNKEMEDDEAVNNIEEESI